MNQRDFEKTLEMFITENLPPQEAQPQLTIIETAPEPKTTTLIDTGAQKPRTQLGGVQSGGLNDMRSYVLDEYKEVLFPKQISKYEKAHNEAMERQKARDQQESVEVRKKILALAQMMQYDDDVEESCVSQQKMDRAQPATSEQQRPTRSEEKKEPEPVVSEDEDDFLDDPMAFVERQDSQQTDAKHLFEDDPKASAPKIQRRQNEP